MRLAGADGVEQEFGLGDVITCHQDLAAVARIDDQAIAIADQVALVDIDDPALRNQPCEAGRLLGAAAEAYIRKTDAHVRIFGQPLLRLTAKLDVHRLQPGVIAHAKRAIGQCHQRIGLRARARYVMAAQPGILAGCLLGGIEQLGHIGLPPVRLSHVVSGAVEERDEQARRRISAVVQDRDGHPREFMLRIGVACEVVSIGGMA